MIQLTGETVVTAIDTVPETVAPDTGDVIFTPPLGVAVAAGVGVRAVVVGTAVGVAVGDPPFLTFTVMEVVATIALLLLYPLTEIKCVPLATPVELQEILNGGEDATQFPSM